VTATAAELNNLSGGSLVTNDVTATAAELNVTDGATAVNDTTGKAAILATDGGVFFNGPILSGYNQGTVGAAEITAQETGYGAQHITKLSLNAFDLGAIPGADAEGIGAKIYTFSADGDIIIRRAGMVIGITGAVGVAADIPDVGIGTVVATGDISSLEGTPAFEEIITGQTWTTGTMDGTDQIAHVYPTAATDLILTKGASNFVFLNIADTWAAASPTNLVTGYIWLDWQIRTY